MKIEQVKKFDTDLIGDINSLLPQLSKSAQPLSEADLRAIIYSGATHLLIAVDQGHVYGMLTLVIFRIPTGVRGWVEDVVVSEEHRGKGVAKALLETAVVLAKSMDAKTLDLTSRPDREAANRLYQKVGFEKRETNVYRVVLA